MKKRKKSKKKEESILSKPISFAIIIGALGGASAKIIKSIRKK